MKKRISVVLIFLLLSIYAVWVYVDKAAGPFQTKLTNEERGKVDVLLKDMKTRCVGRYLIDFPASYIPSGRNIVTVDKAEITASRLYQPAFEQLIRMREKELFEKKTVDPIDMPYLKNKYPLPEGLQGVIFERGEDIGVQDSFRVLEAHLYSNSVAITIELAAKNGTDKRYDEFRKESPNIYNNQVPEKLSQLNELLLRIRGRGEYEIPSDPGNCIPNAFVADNKKDKESIDMLYESDNASQLRFSLSTNNYIREKDSLLERSSGIENSLLSVNGSVLRKGVRKINELSTEELLAKGYYSSNNSKRFDFILLNNEKNGGLKNPVFSLELLNSESVPSPYNQDEIISFWDAISQTLRIRPGAF